MIIMRRKIPFFFPSANSFIGCLEIKSLKVTVIAAKAKVKIAKYMKK